eukprot:4109525-Alexandrium_andersonii.AAC.1
MGGPLSAQYSGRKQFTVLLDAKRLESSARCSTGGRLGRRRTHRLAKARSRSSAKEASEPEPKTDDPHSNRAGAAIGRSAGRPRSRTRAIRGGGEGL